MSEDLRNALNAFLYRTGEASDKFMIVFASNQPDQFDWAINDRIDEMVEFGLPGEAERAKMLKQYFEKYISKPENKAKKITLDEDLGDMDNEYAKIAQRTKGFSGREISKLAIAWQAAAFGGNSATLDKKMLNEVLHHHIAAHKQKEEWKKNMTPLVSEELLKDIESMPEKLV